MGRREPLMIRQTLAAVCSAVALAALLAAPAHAHLGRRLRLFVENGQIVAYGANTGSPDGLPNLRPYAGVVHDHWKNYTLPSLPEPKFAQTYLPEFDVPASTTALVGHAIRLNLVGAFQWTSPVLAPQGVTVPTLTPLDLGEVITITASQNTWTDTAKLGNVLLDPALPAGGDPDVPILYSIVGHPTNEIHILKFVVSSTPPVGGSPLQSSAPVYVMISPDGTTMEQKLHHESVFLEEYLANVPEPSAAMLLAVAIPLAASARRQR